MGAHITHQKRTEKDQNGIASILVVMTLMTVLALISIGFSHLTDREVRQSLDRQLTTEAFYAAESGVNDARDYLTSVNGSSVDPSFSGCTNWGATGNSFFTDKGNITDDQLTRYSCVSVNAVPKELDYDIPAGESVVFKLSGTSLASLSKFFVGWQNRTVNNSRLPLGTCTGPSCPLPQESNLPADDTGVLQLGIYPTMDGSGSCFGSPSLLNGPPQAADTTDIQIECAARSYLLYPNSPDGGSNSVSYPDINKNGATVRGNCVLPATVPVTTFSSQATPRYCNSVITDLPNVVAASSAANPSAYYLRLTALYSDLSVSIQATDNASPTPTSLPIANVEGIVDVTGVGNDVLRRIQARIPLQNSYPQTYGIQSMESVCKLFRNPVVSPTQYDQAVPDNTVGTQYGSDNACTYPSGSNQIASEGLGGIDITPPGVSISASPDTINVGQGSTINWSVTNAVVCNASGSWGPGAVSNTGGSQGVGSFGSTGVYTYTIACTNSNGDTTTKSATVTVNNPPPPPPVTCPTPSASNNGAGSSSASGGPCSDGSANWTYSWTWFSAKCGESGNGGGNSNSANFGFQNGNWSVTYTLSGTGGADPHSATTSWNISPLGAC